MVRIGALIQSLRLNSKTIRDIDPSLRRDQISWLLDRDPTRFSADRLSRIEDQIRRAASQTILEAAA